MSETTYQITEAQKFLLDQNAQFHPVSFLDDGDLIICEDAGSCLDENLKPALTLWGIWLLTREGNVQGIAYHYANHHDWINERPGHQAAEDETPETPDVPRIIDTVYASQYLLLKYRVNVSDRTVRNWLRDGKLSGGQLGDHDRAPWYTTRDAIDQASKRAWFPPPEPEPTPQQVADALVARAAEAAERFTANVMGNTEHEAELERDARLGHLLADVDDTELEADAAADEWLSHLEDDVDDDDPRAPRDWAMLTTVDVDDDDETEQEANDGLPADVP